MTMHTTRRTAALVLALGVAGAAFAQGLYWESTTSGGPLGDKKHASRTAVMPRMMKVMQDDEKAIVMVRMDREKFYSISTEEKSYWEMTFAEMEASMKAAEAQMNKAMEGMSDEQKQMMEKMMGGMMPGKKKDAKVEVAATGERKTIAGYPCTKWVATSEGKELTTMWVTKEVKQFPAIRKEWMEYYRRISASNPMMGKGLMEAYQKIDGFPMEMLIAGMTTTVTKVEGRSTPAAEFEVPAGYTRKDAPALGKKED